MEIEADRVVVRLAAELDQYDRAVANSATEFQSGMARMEQSANRAEKSVARSAQSISQSTAVIGQRSRLLGYQIADIGSQLSGGQSPFIILAQQAPQVANALEGTTGVAGRMAGFFSGPWGAALLAAGSILGTLIFKARETGDTLESLVQKLKDDARAAELADRAHQAFTQTLEGHIDAQRRLNEEIAKGVESENTRLRKTQSQARGDLVNLQNELAQKRRAVVQAERDLALVRSLPVNPSEGGGAAAATQLLLAQRKVAQAKADVNRVVGDIATAQQSIRSAQVGLSADAADAAVDRMEAIRQKYDQQAEAAKTAALANDKLSASLTKTLTGIEQNRKAELKAEQDRQKEANKKGPSAATLAKREARDADQAEARRQSIANEITATDIDLLQAKRDDVTTIDDIAATDLKILDLQKQHFDQNIDSLVKRGKMDQAEGEILKGLNQQKVDAQKHTVNRRTEAQKSQEQLSLADGLIDNQIDVLRSEESLATSQKERRRLALEILDAEYEKLRISLQAIVDSKTTSDVDKKLAQAKLDQLAALKANAAESAKRQTAGPLESYLTQIKETQGSMNEALEGVAVDGLKQLTDGLAGAATGFTSLGDVARNVLASITADLIRLIAQQVILKVVSEAIGATSASATSSAQSAGAAASASGAAATASTVAQAATVAAAWAPAAAAASLATLGANAGPAIGALLTTYAVSAALAATSAAAKAFAGGGYVDGPGTSTSDSIPARLSRGEYVVRASAVRRIGVSNLDAINEGRAAHLARGGQVAARTVSPMNFVAAPAGRSGGFSGGDIQQLRGLIGEAVSSGLQAMPDIALYPTVDAADVGKRWIGSRSGQRDVVAFITANSGAINAALGR